MARSQAELCYLAEFERLIINLSGRFINLAATDLDREIDWALEVIGNFAQVDRSYVFQFSDDGAYFSNTHEWCANGIEPQIEHLQRIPSAHAAWAIRRIRGADVLYVADVADLPAEARYERREFARQGIKSLLNVPLICAGKVLGFAGFDSVRTHKAWPEDNIRLLKVVGEIIAGAIERERTTAALTRQVSMEKLLADVSTRFINVPTEELDNEITYALGEIGRFAGVDRSYVFQFGDDGRTMSNTHEWRVPDVSAQIDSLQGLPTDSFAYSISGMRRGEVFHVLDVSDMPEEAKSEMDEFLREGIKTLITVPIMVHGSMIGFVGFDAVKQHKTWLKDDIRLLQFVAVILANTLDRKHVDARLKASLQEKEFLLREIHHRVKNNMQVIYSLLYLQANALRRQGNSAALEGLTQSYGRIKAMATIHDRLYRSADLTSIDFGDYLQVLLPSLIDTYGASERIAVIIDAGGVRLDVDAAIPCGLIVNELITNSLKHAFPSNRAGRIEVRLRYVREAEVELTICDDGVGRVHRVDHTTGAGLGLQLVGDLVKQIGGTLELEQVHGTRFTIRFASEST